MDKKKKMYFYTTEYYSATKMDKQVICRKMGVSGDYNVKLNKSDAQT